MLNVFDSIMTMSAPNLRRFAEELDRAATRARCRADELDAREAYRALRPQRIKQNRREMREAAHQVIQLIETGFPEKEALEVVRADFPIALDVLRSQVTKVRTTRAHQERSRRNRRILQLRGQGKTDAEIGEAVGLHHKSVSRIISEELRIARRAAQLNAQMGNRTATKTTKRRAAESKVIDWSAAKAAAI